MNLIVNADKNWGIGRENQLLVHIPNDMKMFRQTTTGKVVVMGRKTLESFPNGMPLPKTDEHRPDDRSGLRRPGSHCGPQPGRIV